MRKLNGIFWLLMLTTTAISFALLFIGVKFILNNEITTQNLIAYALFSLILGLLSSVLYLLKLKIILVFFNAGLLVGFFQMFVLFFKDMDGWGDLTGLISLFTWVVIGLGLGAVAQLSFYLYKKYINKKNNI